jgi:hypothetical protein
VAFGEKNKAKSSGSTPNASGSRRKASSARKKPPRKPTVYIFWLVFFILIICLFIVNMDAIRTSLRNTGIIAPLDRPVQEQDALPPEAVPPGPDGMSYDEPPDAGDVPDTVPPPTPEPPAALDAPDALPPETPPIQPAPREDAEQPVVQPTPPPEILRERAMYLMQVDPDGTIVRTKVTRNLPVTDSPLADVLNTLLQGPSAEEKNRGLISLIPGGTRLLSAAVRGSTAYINFNENFLFNEYGVEGYAGQLRQIVWTVTEFSNVKDVQILIEGRRIDYLGESIWMGSPVGRESR